MDETTEYCLTIHTSTYDALEGSKRTSDHTHYSTDYKHIRSEFNAMVVDELTRHAGKRNANIEKIYEHVFEYGVGSVERGDTQEYFIRLRISTI